MTFTDAARLVLEHREVSAMQLRTAETLRGLFSQHGFKNPTVAYQELRMPASGLRLETKFGVWEPLSGHGLRVRAHLALTEDADSGTHGDWGYSLDVTRPGSAEFDNISHGLCEMVGGTTPALVGWLDAATPAEAGLARLREHGYFSDRGKQLGDFIRLVLAKTAR